MKKAILARAFRGELGTNDPAEEWAGVILYPLNFLIVPLGSFAPLPDFSVSSTVLRKSVRIVFFTMFFTILLLLKDNPADEKSGRGAKLPKGTIKKFKGYKITAEKDSLSYMVMVSPYLSMFKSGSLIPAGDLNIAVDKLDNVLRSAKAQCSLPFYCC